MLNDRPGEVIGAAPFNLLPTESRVYRRRWQLVISGASLMPARCIFCNEPGTTLEEVKLMVPHGHAVGGPISGTLSLIFADRFLFRYYTCGRHPWYRRPRARGFASAGLMLLVFVVWVGMGVTRHLADAEHIAFGVAAGISFLMVLFFAWYDLAIDKVDGVWIYIRGTSSKFLNSLGKMP